MAGNSPALGCSAPYCRFRTWLELLPLSSRCGPIGSKRLLGDTIPVEGFRANLWVNRGSLTIEGTLKDGFDTRYRGLSEESSVLHKAA